MARPLRIDHAGAIWHVTSRGNERADVFRDDGDRERFLAVLARTVGLFRWRLHAYVLMGNHYHLLLETPEPTLSRGMAYLNGVYTQFFNRRHGRVGHLFQGRFKAVLVEKESHLLELVRYAVLNPVRAGVCATAAAWPWSSFGATAGLVRPPGWLDLAWTLAQFAHDEREARRKYRAFVADGLRGEYRPWGEVRSQIYLGSEDFAARWSGVASGRSLSPGIPRAQREPVRPSVDVVFDRVTAALGVSAGDLVERRRLLARQRALVAGALRRWALAPAAEISDRLGVRPSRASALANQGLELLDGKEKRLRGRLEDELRGHARRARRAGGRAGAPSPRPRG
ncbi:transposase [Acidobacteria bacterium ACD]|nr:MAG: transposase [Acidobacteriota bacterium]MCE7956573.1 transposase [Acidobacteria bacterium ACB2]MDL1949490.1 transposase [Acidobacteria bacterium ACD]